MRRTFAVVLYAAGLSVALSGCVLLPFLPHQQPQQTPFATDGPLPQGPAGWNDLGPCDASDRWVWVEGYPIDEFEGAGLQPECGGTYFDPDLPTYISAGDSTVTIEQLDDLRANLEASGYEQSAATFEPPQPDDEPGLVGSWQYDRNIDDPGAAETIYIVNVWPGGEPVVYQTFVDYESPATHALQK